MDLPSTAETLHAIAEHTEADLNGAIDDYRKGKGQPGGVIRAGYALWALEAAGWPPDETTAAVTAISHASSTEPTTGRHIPIDRLPNQATSPPRHWHYGA